MDCRPSTRHAFPLLFLTLASCATDSRDRRDRNPAAEEQWRTAQSQSPLVAAAFIQSLLAITEEGENAVRAREHALWVARSCGLVTTQRPPRPACAICEPAASQGEMPRYLRCLSQRLNCLGPP